MQPRNQILEVEILKQIEEKRVTELENSTHITWLKVG